MILNFLIVLYFIVQCINKTLKLTIEYRYHSPIGSNCLLRCFTYSKILIIVAIIFYLFKIEYLQPVFLFYKISKFDGNIKIHEE